MSAKEMSWPASEVAGDQADILLREEALGNDDEQIDRQRQRGEEDHQRREFPAQRQVEPALIGMQHGVEARSLH